MGEASLEVAAELGCRAMQCDTEVSTTTGAVHPWRSPGFRIVGTVPHDFCLPDGHTVWHGVTYRALT